MRINQAGVETPGTIRSIAPTGRKDIGGVEYQVEVEVRPAAGEPYTASFNQPLVEQQMPFYTEGAEVTLKVDPEDPNSILLWGGTA